MRKGWKIKQMKERVIRKTERNPNRKREKIGK